MSETLDAQQVADYLSQHPEFFVEHEDLLARLTIPHASGAAVSLVERQLRVLRDQHNKSNKKLEELVEIARENEHLSHLMHQLALTLVEAGSLNEVIANVEDFLRDQMAVDFVCLRFVDCKESVKERLGDACLGVGSSEYQLFSRELKKGVPQLGRFSESQLEALFGDGAIEVASSAIVPLMGGEALLGLAGRSPSRFHPGKEVLFLDQLGELITSALRRNLCNGEP